MTEIEWLIDFHKNAARQGPGSEDDTLKALSFIDINHDDALKIADLGCGSGGQTITLAENITGTVTAVDLFPEFLLKLNQRAGVLGLENKISTLEASIDNLPFEEKEYDIIWSEGAIYNVGFESGIKSWKRFLKPGGYLAVSEISWKTKNRPLEIEEHWVKEYPEIDRPINKIRILETNDFSLSGFFFLPETSWIENYYKPMEKRFDEFLKTHDYCDTALKIVEAEKQEIILFEKYKEYFGYGFYIARKQPDN